MRVLWILSLASLVFPGTAWGQDSIPPETLAEVKRATVYVKVKAFGREGSGTGFLVRVDGDDAYIVTNHHVVEPPVLIAPPDKGPLTPALPLPSNWSPRAVEATLKNADVSVVRDSGTKQEQSFRARLLAVDPERDLAILHVKGAKDWVKPIDPARAPKLVETTPVFTFGFPFGKVLATSKGSPAITVGKGSISSLRQDDDGNLAFVQIDGSLNPGNSGGPIVDAKGQLVGVAVATIRNSSGIGLAIPGVEVIRMLQGRVGLFRLMPGETADGKTKIRVELAVIDPLKKISAIDLYHVPAKDIAETTKSLVEAKVAKKTALKLDGPVAFADVIIDGDAREATLALQAVFDNGVRKEQSSLARMKARSPTVAKVKNPPAKEKPALEGATKILGGGIKGDLFRDDAPEGGLLIGLELGVGKFASKDAITAIRPIYRTKDGEILGKQYGGNAQSTMTVKAKDGFAVGAVQVRAALPLWGLSIQFQRIKGDKLDPDDNYQSRWVGQDAGARLELIGHGTPVVGIVGKTNMRGECSGLGLLLKQK